jgi:tetratricopeptide (TPR) repeat protein
MGSLLVSLLLLVQASAPPAVSAPVATDPAASSEAYYHFLLGRLLEGAGDVDSAVEAHERAAGLDPDSAEIRAELAGLYARQNRAQDAIQSAEAALRIDRDNPEANFILGSVYAALAQGDTDERSSAAVPQIKKALEYLEKARPSRRFDLGFHLSLGRLYMRIGEHEKATEVLTLVVEQEPGAADAGLLLAQAFEAQGRREDAVRTLRETVAAEPRFFNAWVYLGELSERDRRWKDAAEAYGRAAEQNPRSLELRMRRGQALLNSGEAAAAREVLTSVVADYPTEAGALYLLAEAHRAVKDYEAAESTARRLTSLEPGGLRGPYALALVFEARHDYRRVVETLQPVVEGVLAQDTPQARPLTGLLLHLGFAYQELGQRTEALAAFEQARQASPDDPTIDLYLAQVHLSAKAHGEALAATRRGGTARSDDPRFERLEAQALTGLGRHDEAIALLDRQVRARPDAPEAYLALATAYSEAGRLDEGTALLVRAAERFPDNAVVPFQRGALLERNGRHVEAEAAFREALRRDPLHAPTLNYLGYMLADRNERLDEALALITRALEVEPHNPSYIDSLGWAHFRKGNLEEARRHLQRAAEKLPSNSVVQDHLGDVMHALGDRKAAAAAWRAALAGDLEQTDPAAIQRKLREVEVAER